MAVLSRDEYFARLHDRIGDDNSDAAISFLEDMSDTYEDLTKKATGDGVDWERKYHENDEAWKAKYRHRFLSGNTGNYEDESNKEKENEKSEEKITFEDLFEGGC